MLNLILSTNNFHCQLNAEYSLRDVEMNLWTRSPLSWIWEVGLNTEMGGEDHSSLREGNDGKHLRFWEENINSNNNNS